MYQPLALFIAISFGSIPPSHGKFVPTRGYDYNIPVNPAGRKNRGVSSNIMRKTLVIACALKKEAGYLRKTIGFKYHVEVTGLGPDRTLKNLEAYFDHASPSALIFTGVAGQLNPDFKLGQIVYPAAWCLESGTRFEVAPPLKDHLSRQGIAVEETGITVRKPVVREKNRLKLFKETGASICDMESAAAMMIADSYGIPCIAPKIISDTGKSGMLDFYRHFDKNMQMMAEETFRLASIMSDLLEEELI